MAKLRVHCLSMSLDGYVAGPDQGLEHPLGVGGEQLHEWMFATRTWHAMSGEDGGESGVDDDFMAASFEGAGATIMGRNMFGPVRGAWGDARWNGWWGDDPPYHHPVFVLTHHPRDPLPMQGGTTFHFVDAPIDAVLAQAFEVAGGLDVRLGGGASVVRQFMAAGLVDTVHLAIAPVLLGGGERLFEPDRDRYDGYECVEFVPSAQIAHILLAKRTDDSDRLLTELTDRRV
jgi:dihydrofolate reductase